MTSLFDDGPSHPNTDLLEGLNPVQHEAVTHADGPLLIIAGAGSGKTRVLTQRIAHLIRDLGVSPFEILAITFTNKAAGEMKERVAALVGPVAEKMWVSTFHSACVRILRRDGSSKFGPNSRWGIFPTISGGWLLSDEAFFKSKSIDFLKLRMSYGVSGNDQIPNFAYRALLNGEGVYVFDDVISLQLTRQKIKCRCITIGFCQSIF